MVWSLLVRLVARIALARLLEGSLRRSRTPFSATAGGAAAPATDARVERARHLAAAGVEVTRIIGRLLAGLVFMAGSLTLLAAGTTLSTLGPRWLGIAMLVLAAASGIVAVVELRSMLRLRNRLRRRLLAERVRQQPLS